MPFGFAFLRMRTAARLGRPAPRRALAYGAGFGLDIVGMRVCARVCFTFGCASSLRVPLPTTMPCCVLPYRLILRCTGRLHTRTPRGFDFPETRFAVFAVLWDVILVQLLLLLIVLVLLLLLTVDN